MPARDTVPRFVILRIKRVCDAKNVENLVLLSARDGMKQPEEAFLKAFLYFKEPESFEHQRNVIMK